MRPAVSVVTPAYNAAGTIGDTHRSLLEQSDIEWEWIVVDNSSTDETRDLVSSMASDDARVRLLEQPKRGVYHARNLGLDHAIGENICFLDADDLLGPASLSGRVAAMEQASEHQLAYCEARYVTYDLEPMDWIYATGDIVTFSDAHGNPCVMSSLMGRSELVKRHRFPHRSFGEDWLFLARMLRTGATMVRAHDCHVLYRQSQDSAVQANMLAHEFSCLEVLDAIYGQDATVSSAPQWLEGLTSPPLRDVKGRRILRLLTFSLLRGRLEEANYAVEVLETLGYTDPKESTVQWALETVISRAEQLSRESVRDQWYPALTLVGRSMEALRLGLRLRGYSEVVRELLSELDPSVSLGAPVVEFGSEELWDALADGDEVPVAVVVDPMDYEPLKGMLDHGWALRCLVPNDTIRAAVYTHPHAMDLVYVDARNPTSSTYSGSGPPFDWRGWIDRAGLHRVSVLWVGSRTLNHRLIEGYPWSDLLPKSVVLEQTDTADTRVDVRRFAGLGYSMSEIRSSGRRLLVGRIREGGDR